MRFHKIPGLAALSRVIERLQSEHQDITTADLPETMRALAEKLENRLSADAQPSVEGTGLGDAAPLEPPVE